MSETVVLEKPEIIAPTVQEGSERVVEDGFDEQTSGNTSAEVTQSVLPEELPRASTTVTFIDLDSDTTGLTASTQQPAQVDSLADQDIPQDQGQSSFSIGGFFESAASAVSDLTTSAEDLVADVTSTTAEDGTSYQSAPENATDPEEGEITTDEPGQESPSNTQLEIDKPTDTSWLGRMTGAVTSLFSSSPDLQTTPTNQQETEPAPAGATADTAASREQSQQPEQSMFGRMWNAASNWITGTDQSSVATSTADRPAEGLDQDPETDQKSFLGGLLDSTRSLLGLSSQSSEIQPGADETGEPRSLLGSAWDTATSFLGLNKGSDSSQTQAPGEQGLLGNLWNTASSLLGIGNSSDTNIEQPETSRGILGTITDFFSDPVGKVSSAIDSVKGWLSTDSEQDGSLLDSIAGLVDKGIDGVRWLGEKAGEYVPFIGESIQKGIDVCCDAAKAITRSLTRSVATAATTAEEALKALPISFIADATATVGNSAFMASTTARNNSAQAFAYLHNAARTSHGAEMHFEESTIKQLFKEWAIALVEFAEAKKKEIEEKEKTVEEEMHDEHLERHEDVELAENLVDTDSAEIQDLLLRYQEEAFLEEIPVDVLLRMVHEWKEQIEARERGE